MNAYDFDNTIYDGESALDFFMFYLKKKPELVRYLPTTLKGFYLYKREKITLEVLINDYASLLESYFSNHSGDLEQAVTEFWNSHMYKIKKFYFKKQKYDDVLITASPDFFVTEIADRLNIHNVICTRFDLSTGKIIAPCFRESKVDRFLEKYPKGKIDCFYTDSMNDRFLMPFAEKVYIVKNDEIRRIE